MSSKPQGQANDGSRLASYVLAAATLMALIAVIWLEDRGGKSAVYYAGYVLGGVVVMLWSRLGSTIM